MRRGQPHISPLSFIFSVILFSGLGFSLWRSGGLAFSPGALSDKSDPSAQIQGFASHADFEETCKYCHQPLKSGQSDLCLDCHREISNQISTGSGLHGTLENVKQCALCHSDHKGRDFDPLKDALDVFDHQVTNFSLVWHQVNYDSTLMICDTCHIDEKYFSVSDQICTNCHTDHDTGFVNAHIRDFGSSCLACHDGTDRMSNFDHVTTNFPLDGEHLVTQCTTCHEENRFEGLPDDCMGCHAEPLVHLGLFESNCETCHSTDSWKPAKLSGELFDHEKGTQFSLAKHHQDYQDQAINCQICHTSSYETVDLLTCVECHQAQDVEFMQAHQDQFGSNCLDCHDGVDRMSDFDHATYFPLDGRHAEADCESCHLDDGGKKRFAGTPVECSECHAEPEIHAGSFGLKCQYCHTAEGWTPAQLRIHGFPLDHGGQGQADCQTCHLQAYPEYTCYGCHEHQEAQIVEIHDKAGISREDLPKCYLCHPNGLKSDIPLDK